MDGAHAPFSAKAVSVFTFSIFFRPSSSLRLLIVFLKKSAWFSNREPAGMPLLY